MNVKSDALSHGRCDNKVSFCSRQQAAPIQQMETRHAGQYGTEHWGTFLLRIPTSFFQRPPFLPSASVAREMVRATWLPLQRFTSEATCRPCSLQTLVRHRTHSAPSAGIKGALALLIFKKLSNFSKLVSEFPFSYSLSSQTKLSDCKT